MTSHVLRYTFVLGNVTGEIEYDPAKPESYTAALKTLADTRAKLVAAGAVIEKETARPVAVKG